jgi:hypothetical protein
MLISLFVGCYLLAYREHCRQVDDHNKYYDEHGDLRK